MTDPAPPTPSTAFERIVAGAGLSRRARQDRAVTLAHDAVANGQRVIVQAPTGVGKSYVALATAADAGRPGSPGIIVTTTNSLGDQYLRDCAAAAEHAEFTYTRVMGATHYVCVDSAGARDDLDETMLAVRAAEQELAEAEDDGDEADVADLRDKVRAVRDAWLTAHVPADDSPIGQAVRYELRTAGLPSTYRCPRHPGCRGTRLGGCGSKAARSRSFRVDVVISNFHLLGWTYKTGLPLVPLASAAVLVVDEAHRLPDVLAELDGGEIDEFTGSRKFEGEPELAAAVNEWIIDSLDRTQWSGESLYDTEGLVRPDPRGLAVFVDTWKALLPGARWFLEQQTAQEAGELGPGDVVSLLRNWTMSARPGSSWTAWTARERVSDGNGGRAWKPDRTIQLRRVDAAARITPALLPAAAVLMTGTVGRTLPDRLGLPNAAVHDLGQEFAWATVRGTISRYSGVKQGIVAAQRSARDRVRVEELAEAIRHHRGALVLANARSDAVFVGRQLAGLLRGYEVLVAEGAGSLAAEDVRRRYVARRTAGRPAVLVGVDSFATGLDLPGELCTFVAWWVCVKGGSGVYDRAVETAFPGYLDEQFRARFAQGVGRLLRHPDDRGEIMICDSRGRQHLQPHRLDRVDQHLAEIHWVHDHHLVGH